MKTKTTLFLVCCTLLAFCATAQQQVSEKEAKRAAVSLLYSKANILKVPHNAEIKTVHTLSNKRNNNLMYEIVFQNGAAILLSGSKACLPLLGYYIKDNDDNGAVFDTTNINVPCCLLDFLFDYIHEIELCFAQENIELHYEKQWDELQQSNFSKRSVPATIIVHPLLATQWGQLYANNYDTFQQKGDCHAYNYYVNETSKKCNDCDNLNYCSAGCVAVAMAQIMNYWKYPVYLPYRKEQYDWCNMPNKLSSNSVNYEKERNAVARLIRSCGLETYMHYCSSGCASGNQYEQSQRRTG
jgi:radical SAM protein with 4Fe4S-binding SPASM domain